MKLSRVGVDLAKNVYQLHGVDRFGKTVWKWSAPRTLDQSYVRFSSI